MDLRERDYALLRAALLPEADREEALEATVGYTFGYLSEAQARYDELKRDGLINDDGLTDAGRAALSPTVPVIVTSGCYIRRKEVVEAWRVPLPGETAEPYPDWLVEQMKTGGVAARDGVFVINIARGSLHSETCKPGDWIYRNSLGALGVLTGPAFASKYVRVP